MLLGSSTQDPPQRELSLNARSLKQVKNELLNRQAVLRKITPTVARCRDREITHREMRNEDVCQLATAAVTAPVWATTKHSMSARPVAFLTRRRPAFLVCTASVYPLLEVAAGTRGGRTRHVG